MQKFTQYQLTRLGKLLASGKAYVRGFDHNSINERCYIVCHWELGKEYKVPVADRPAWVIFCANVPINNVL